MSENTKNININLQVFLGNEAGQSKLDIYTRQLQSELKSKVESISLIEKESTSTDTRGLDPVTLGALAITILPNTLADLLKLLHNWCLRTENRKVIIEIRRSKKHSVKVELSGDVPVSRLKEIIKAVEGK